jgi:hypothetical protein
MILYYVFARLPSAVFCSFTQALLFVLQELLLDRLCIEELTAYLASIHLASLLVDRIEMQKHRFLLRAN